MAALAARDAGRVADAGVSADAATALLDALAAALRADPALAATLQAVEVDRHEPSGARPAVTLAAPASADWSTKTERGREVAVRLAVHDRPERAARARELMAAAGAALERPPAVAGWRLVSLVEREPASGAVQRPPAPGREVAEWRARLLREAAP